MNQGLSFLRVNQGPFDRSSAIFLEVYSLVFSDISHCIRDTGGILQGRAGFFGKNYLFVK